MADMYKKIDQEIDRLLRQDRRVVIRTLTIRALELRDRVNVGNAVVAEPLLVATRPLDEVLGWLKDEGMAVANCIDPHITRDIEPSSIIIHALESISGDLQQAIEAEHDKGVNLLRHASTIVVETMTRTGGDRMSILNWLYTDLHRSIVPKLRRYILDARYRISSLAQ